MNQQQPTGQTEPCGQAATLDIMRGMMSNSDLDPPFYSKKLPSSCRVGRGGLGVQKHICWTMSTSLGIAKSPRGSALHDILFTHPPPPSAQPSAALYSAHRSWLATSYPFPLPPTLTPDSRPPTRSPPHSYAAHSSGAVDASAFRALPYAASASKRAASAPNTPNTPPTHQEPSTPAYSGLI